MIHDIATLTAQPTRISIDGEVYDFHPLTISEYGELQSWIDKQFPDPFDVVNRQVELGREVVDAKGRTSRQPYNVTQQQFLYRVALESSTQGRHLLGTPVADEKVRSMEGTKQLIVLALRKGRPEFSDADADALFRKLTIGDIARIFAATNAEMVLSDPKAQTPSGTETMEDQATNPPNPSTGG